MDGMNGSLDGIISELTDLLGRAEWTQQQAQEALNKANDEVRRIKAILKAANPEPKAEPTPKAKAKKVPKVNEETRAKVLKAIQEHRYYGKAAIPGVPGSFTVSTLTVEGLHQSSVRTAVLMLREEGIVRAVGLVPNSPRQPPMAYTLGEGNEASE